MALSFISYVLIPLCTLILARGTDWFSTNFSVISIAMSRQLEFLTWSGLIGCYFYYSVTNIFKIRRTLQNIKKETVSFFLAAGLMILFVLTPYIPTQLPFLSSIHVTSAFVCSVLFYLCLLSLTLRAYFYAPQPYRICLIELIIIAVFCICAFLLTGIINSAMEICFVLVGSVTAKQLLALEYKQLLLSEQGV